MLQLQADLKPRPWPPIECSSLPSRSAKFRVGRAATRRHRASTRKARQSTRSARWATSGATPAMVFAGSPSAWQPGAYCCRWRGPRRSRRPARQPFSDARGQGRSRRALETETPPMPQGVVVPVHATCLATPLGISDSIGNAERSAPGLIGSREECAACSARKPGAPGPGNPRERSGISPFSFGTHPGRLHVAPGTDGLRTALSVGNFHDAVDQVLEACGRT